MIAVRRGKFQRRATMGSVPFQVVQSNGTGGLDSRESGNDELSGVKPHKLERYRYDGGA